MPPRRVRAKRPAANQAIVLEILEFFQQSQAFEESITDEDESFMVTDLVMVYLKNPDVVPLQPKNKVEEAALRLFKDCKRGEQYLKNYPLEFKEYQKLETQGRKLVDEKSKKLGQK